MNRVASVLTVYAFLTSLSVADTFTGKLVDAVCKLAEGQDPSMARCGATSATQLFAIELPDANVLNLDAAGNQKAANAVKNIKTANPHATVTGAAEGQIVKVETIEVR